MNAVLEAWDDTNECATCDGNGGWDISTDCETYDEWHDCPDCGGSGVLS